MLKGLLSALVMTVMLANAGYCASPASIQVVRDQGSVKEFHAEVEIDAPVEAVWRQMTNYGGLKDFLPGYNRSTVLKSSGNTSTVDIGLKASPFLPAFRYQVKIQADQSANLIKIQRISGDFNNIQASYRLIPIAKNTKTKLVYHLHIDLGSQVPSMGATGVLKGNTEKGMLAFRSYCGQQYRRTLTAQATR